jgi:NADH dehydrogenase
VQQARPTPHRVVVIGSGFGGLFATKALREAPVKVTLVARTAHHLFQPLLYQVATGILAVGEVAPATRDILRAQGNATVLLGEVTAIDLEARTVNSLAPTGTTTIPYDSLIVAAGATQSYFGNEHFAEHAPGLKTIEDALDLRARIFGAFELAELETDPALVDRWLTFVVVGAGATGVEMAGQIAELAHRTLKDNFRHIDPTRSRVVLLDAAPSVLGSFGERLSGIATRQLAAIGVEVRLGMKVVGVDATGIDVVDQEGRHRRIDSMCKMWAAGVTANPLGARLAAGSGAGTDRAGRVQVAPDCSLPGHPEVFVVGDLMALDELPGVAQVAIQSAEHAADQIARRLRGEETGQPFRYKDKGSMATVSRFHAVASVGRIRLAGFPAWAMWLAVHLVYLVGFKNRLTTLLHWAHSFIGRGRAERVVIRQAPGAGAGGRRDPDAGASRR